MSRASNIDWFSNVLCFEHRLVQQCVVLQIEIGSAVCRALNRDWFSNVPCFEIGSAVCRALRLVQQCAVF